MTRLLPAAALLLAAAALADDPPRITLIAGGSRSLCDAGCRVPICDDPHVAELSGEGMLRAISPGKTICSISTVAGRRIFEIVVVPPPKQAAPQKETAPSTVR
jgi:hypothetical protein